MIHKNYIYMLSQYRFLLLFVVSYPLIRQVIYWCGDAWCFWLKKIPKRRQFWFNVLLVITTRLKQCDAKCARKLNIKWHGENDVVWIIRKLASFKLCGIFVKWKLIHFDSQIFCSLNFYYKTTHKLLFDSKKCSPKNSPVYHTSKITLIGKFFQKWGENL